MQVVDRINARYGRAALHVGRVPADPGWQMRRGSCRGRYDWLDDRVFS
ncbi:DUF4113 domain-containing protein [Pseudomonas oryzihabitans]